MVGAERETDQKGFLLQVQIHLPKVVEEGDGREGLIKNLTHPNDGGSLHLVRETGFRRWKGMPVSEHKTI